MTRVFGRPVGARELDGVKMSGALIGRLDVMPIFDTVIDQHGRRYAFNGVAPASRSGGIDPAALREDEFVLAGRLIYRLVE